MPAGETVIDLRKEGFEGQQLVVNLTAGASVTQTITLPPTHATRLCVGKQMLDSMVGKLGGNAGLQQALLVSASGNASLIQAGGRRTEWQVTSRLNLPSMAMIEISGAKRKWWTSLSGDDCNAGGAPQIAGRAVALEMEKRVRVYRDCQLAALAPRLQGMTVTALAMTPMQGQWQFRAAGSGGSYHVFLNPDYTPRSIVYDPASGHGGGMEVLYSDYATVGQCLYPKSMTIKYAAQQQRGLELHCSEVQFVDKIADEEFHQ